MTRLRTLHKRKRDSLWMSFVMARLESMVANAEIHITLPMLGDNGTQLRAACFTVDKNIYTLRLSDETPDSVKVWIEEKVPN